MQQTDKSRETTVRITCALQTIGHQGAVRNIDASQCRGPHDDLQIAAMALAEHYDIPADTMFVGELGLDGKVRPTRHLALTVPGPNTRRLVVPAEQATEAAAFFPELEVYAVGNIVHLVHYLDRPKPVAPAEFRPGDEHLSDLPTLLRGSLQRAVDLVEVGEVPYLIGVGSTAIARRIATQLEPMTADEAIEASRIHSIAGLLTGGLLRARPFRAPHHTVSHQGLLGTTMNYGEVALAKHGILFLDEAAEFRTGSLRDVAKYSKGSESSRIVLADVGLSRLQQKREQDRNAHERRLGRVAKIFGATIVELPEAS
jgi:magnesium chelatase family protein